MTRLMISLALLPLLGCSLMNPPNGGGQKPPSEWQDMAPVIQSRVKYVAMFAFSIDSVKPHKAQVCQSAQDIANWLDDYDDKDASFEALRAVVFSATRQIEDPNVRNAVTIVMDIVLTEAFNYGWEHYDGFMDRDEAQSAVIIAGAVAGGIREACEMMVNPFSAGTATTDALTVPGE